MFTFGHFVVDLSDRMVVIRIFVGDSSSPNKHHVTNNQFWIVFDRIKKENTKTKLN